MTSLERATVAAREEIIRQYREDERAKCPAGRSYYEEHISPFLIAEAILAVLKEKEQENASQ